jgi:ABC-2 type transport system permease protein
VSRHGLVAKTLRDQRGVTIGMSVAAFLIGVGMIALFPSVASAYEDVEFPEFFDLIFGEASIGTPAGFLTLEFFSWVPLILITVAVIAGTASVASEEANGTLELLLAEPVTRRALLLRKTLGLGIAVAIMCSVSYAGLLAGRVLISEFDLGAMRMLEAIVMMMFITWFFLAMSILASAALPTRTIAAVTVTAGIVIAYFVNIASSLVSGLSWLENLTPFAWTDYTEVLLHGTQAIESLVLLGFTVLFVALATMAFEAREIGAAGWPRLRKQQRHVMEGGDSR